MASTPYTGPKLQGEYRIVSLFTRTGQVTTSDNVQFDNPVNPVQRAIYNPLLSVPGDRAGNERRALA